MHRIRTMMGEVTLAAVCDGLGGMEEGETASGYMIEEISKWFYQDLLTVLKRRKKKKVIFHSMNRLFLKTHETLAEYAKRKQIYCGTTVSVLLIIRQEYHLFHIGDSGVFLVKKKTKKLTKDHTVKENCLNRCIGIGKYQKPDYQWGKIKNNTGFLLATDGFYRLYSKEELSEILFFYKKRGALPIGGRQTFRLFREGISSEKITRILKTMYHRKAKRENMDNGSAVYLWLD